MDYVPVLSADHVTIAYRIENQWLDTVREITLNIAPRQVYGLVGESGSGKSTLALAIMRSLPGNGRVTGGRILLDGENLLEKSIAEMRHIWGAKMAMVPQDPGSSLNPALKIGRQLAEQFQVHMGLSKREAWARGVDLLREVRLADPERIAERYPHQLSGGQQQRTLIAMALGTQPRFLVLDEPTTNLDVTTEAVVLDLFTDLIHKYQAATLYVTHNLGVVAQICDCAAVLYAGELMEDASVEEIFRQPLHPYTLELLSCVPRLGQSQSIRLRSIEGRLPSRASRPSGCIFAPRCAFAVDRCHAEIPPLVEAMPGHMVRCHRWPEMASGAIGGDVLRQVQDGAHDTQSAPERDARWDEAEPDTLLSVAELTKRYTLNRSVADVLRGRPTQTVKAVDGISLELNRGQTIGLVGESGSGKTTLARCIVGLIERSAGEIVLVPAQLAPDVRDRPTPTLKRLQMVFQNPEETLNPYQTVGETLRRPLLLLAKVPPAEVDARTRALLRAVHLDEGYIDRFPAELSGGEKQRVAIARAFASDPELVILDEAVSALDVSVQAAILNLLTELKAEKDTSYVFISHDLAVVSYLADIIAVVYLGQLVEIGPRDLIFQPPMHPYTEALISAIPVPDPDAQREHIRLEADIPSPVNLPTGCRFHTRCPRKIGAICEAAEPPFVDAGNGQHIRCHIPVEELIRLQRTPNKDSL